MAPYLCDWKLEPAPKTCDRPICEVHAFQVEPDKHLCPEHQDALPRLAAGTVHCVLSRP